MQDENYFNQEIKPHLNSKIEYLGTVSNEQKKRLLASAQGFLHLNTYPEGFGLTLIEAMACGTPVIGMNRGSVPEVIEHKKTGFVVNGPEEVKEAVEKIEKISREDCRKRVEEHFTLGKMLDEYERVYYKILEQKASTN